LSQNLQNLQNLKKPHFRGRKAAEGGTFRNPPPALRRAPRSGLGEFWRCCTEYRDTFSAPRSGLGEFWRCCTEYRGTFSAPEALYESRAEGVPEILPSYFFNSFFFEKLIDPSTGTAQHSLVKSFARRVVSTGGNVFKLDKIIIPVNIGDNHWSLVIAYVQEREIKYYDSMEGGGGTKWMEVLQVYLRGEAKKWVGDSTVRKGLLKLDEWSLVSTTTNNTPQQNNGSDCGAFMCTFAKYVDEDLAMDFTCDDMKHIRVDITCSLLHAMEEVSRFKTVRLLVALWEAGDELRELWFSTAPDARDDAAVYEPMDAKGIASWRPRTQRVPLSAEETQQRKRKKRKTITWKRSERERELWGLLCVCALL